MSNYTINQLHVGAAIKKLRLGKGWSQEVLAEKVGYSVRNLRRIETEGSNSLSVVNTFAEAFEVSALSILTDAVFYLNTSSDSSLIYLC